MARDDEDSSEMEEYPDDSDLERMENMSDDDDAPKPTPASTGGVTGLKHLNEMKTLLGLDSFKERSTKRKERKQRAKARKRAGTVGADGQKVIQTLASSLKSQSAPELVVYNDPRKRKKAVKPLPQVTSAGSAVGNQDEEVSMKQARFDVFRFGVGGFGKEEKADAETAQLLRLGAKPAKNKCYEYGEFKEMRRKEREEEATAKEAQRRSGQLLSRKPGGGVARKKNSSKKKKKGGGKGESIQSKVGTFDGGMLKLSAQEVAKIKGSKK